MGGTDYVIQGAGVPAQAEPQDAQTPGEYVGPFANSMIGGQPFAWWLGILVLIFLWRLASESPAIPGVPANIKVNIWNVALITFTAILGITLAKALAVKYPVPGLTPLIAAV